MRSPYISAAAHDLPHGYQGLSEKESNFTILPDLTFSHRIGFNEYPYDQNIVTNQVQVLNRQPLDDERDKAVLSNA